MASIPTAGPFQMESTLDCITEHRVEDDHLSGRAEGGSLLADSAEVLAQINCQHRQVHLVAWNNKRNLLFDQPLPVVRRHPRADIDKFRGLLALEHVQVLAHRCRRLLLWIGIDDEKSAQSEQFRFRESVPFPEDGGSWPTPLQGVVFTETPERREGSARVHGVRFALATSSHYTHTNI